MWSLLGLPGLCGFSLGPQVFSHIPRMCKGGELACLHHGGQGGKGERGREGERKRGRETEREGEACDGRASCLGWVPTLRPELLG